jgi:hypothetical protein
MGSGLRSTLYTQYMPVGAYPVAEEFARAVREDVAGLLERAV